MTADRKTTEATPPSADPGQAQQGGMADALDRIRCHLGLGRQLV